MNHHKNIDTKAIIDQEQKYKSNSLSFLKDYLCYLLKMRKYFVSLVMVSIDIYWVDITLGRIWSKPYCRLCDWVGGLLLFGLLLLFDWSFLYGRVGRGRCIKKPVLNIWLCDISTHCGNLHCAVWYWVYIDGIDSCVVTSLQRYVRLMVIFFIIISCKRFY